MLEFYGVVVDLKFLKGKCRAANYFSFLKGYMSDQVFILVGRFFYYYYFLSGSLFEIVISYHYLLIIWLKNLSGHNVRPKLRFRRTWADFSRTLSDDRQLCAALQMYLESFC